MTKTRPRPIRTILVVDDDERCLRAATRSLARQVTVVTAATADEGMRLASSARPDLAIVDLVLGTTSGLDLVRVLRATAPRIRIALISGYLSVPATVEAVKAGADQVFCKPIGFREILQAFATTEVPRTRAEPPPTLAWIEWEHIQRVLADCSHNISKTARTLGIHRVSLQRKLRRRGK